MDRTKWKYLKLGEFITEYSVKNKQGDNIPVYSVTNSRGFCKEYFNKEVASEDKTSYKIVPFGYFAYNPSRINVGSIDWQHMEERVIVSPLYNVFYVSDKIKQEYLQFYLKSPSTIQLIDAIAIGTVRLNLKLSMLKEFYLPIPPISDQQTIVTELDKLNEVIALKRKQLADLDSLAQSLFYEMFGDPVVNEKGWTTKDLKEVGKITTGNTPSKAVAEYYNNSYIEWIKTDNIEQNSPIATAAKEFLSEEGCKRGRVVDEGSLLVACIAGSVESIGKSCITNRRVAFNQQINAITPNESTNIVFLYHLVRSMKKVIQDYATTGMKHILTKSAMEGITIPLPPLLLQQSFAAKIAKIEAEKQRLKSSLKDLETLLASRMQYWFDN